MQQFTYLKGSKGSSPIFCQRRRPRSLGKHAGATHALCSLLLIGTRST